MWLKKILLLFLFFVLLNTNCSNLLKNQIEVQELQFNSTKEKELEYCYRIKSKYNIKPGVSYGILPTRYIKIYKQQKVNCLKLFETEVW